MAEKDPSSQGYTTSPLSEGEFERLKAELISGESAGVESTSDQVSAEGSGDPVEQSGGAQASVVEAVDEGVSDAPTGTNTPSAPTYRVIPPGAAVASVGSVASALDTAIQPERATGVPQPETIDTSRSSEQGETKSDPEGETVSDDLMDLVTAHYDDLKSQIDAIHRARRTDPSTKDEPPLKFDAALRIALVRGGLKTQAEVDVLGKGDMGKIFAAWRTARQDDIDGRKANVTDRLMPVADKLREFLDQDAAAFNAKNGSNNSKRYSTVVAWRDALVKSGVYSKEAVDTISTAHLMEMYRDFNLTVAGKPIGGSDRRASRIEAPRSEDPKPEQEDPKKDEGWMNDKIPRADMHLRGDGKYEYEGNLYAEDGYYIREMIEDEREVKLSAQGEPQPPTDPEQEKKDKLLEFAAKIDVNILTAIESGLVTADDRIKNGSATDIGVIRAILVTLKVLGDKSALEVGNLTDDEIRSLTQSAIDKAASTVASPPTPGPTPTPVVPPPAAPRQPMPTVTVPITTPGTRQPMPTVTVPVVSMTGAGGHQPMPTVTVPPQATGHTRQPMPTVTVPGVTPNTPPQSPDARRHLDTMLTNVEAAKLDALDAARDKWAEMSSKRQRRVLFGWAVKRSRKYKEAKAEYEQLSREVGRLGLKDKLAAASTSLEKNVIAAEYWIAEQNAVRERASKYTTDRRWWKVANGVSEWLNKGSGKVRIIKRMGIGLLAGVAASPLGVGPVVAGLTVFSTGQLKDLTGGIDKLTDEQKARLTNAQIPRVITDEEILASQAARSESLYNEDSRSQQTKRALKMGKNAAIGAAAGVTFHYGHEAVRAGYEHLFGSDSASAAGGGAGPSGAEGTTPDASGAGGGHEATPAGPDTPGYGLGDAGPQDALSAPSGHDLLNATDAYYVRPGEGWYETFQAMGIPKEHWSEILTEVGPKLQEMGVADFNDPSGQWWISHSGNLSPDVLQTIADESAKHGYAFNRIA